MTSDVSTCELDLKMRNGQLGSFCFVSFTSEFVFFNLTEIYWMLLFSSYACMMILARPHRSGHIFKTRNWSPSTIILRCNTFGLDMMFGRFRLFFKIRCSYRYSTQFFFCHYRASVFSAMADPACSSGPNKGALTETDFAVHFAFPAACSACFAICFYIAFVSQSHHSRAFLSHPPNCPSSLKIPYLCLLRKAHSPIA